MRSRRKGTVWYFSDVIVAVTSMITVIFMLLVSALIIFVMSAQLDVNVIGGLMYDEPKADTILLTFLDSTSGDHAMKELLSYGVLEGKSTFMLDGQEIDLKTRSKELMNKLTKKSYSLRLDLGEETVVLSSAGTLGGVENIETEAIIQGGPTAEKLILVIVK